MVSITRTGYRVDLVDTVRDLSVGTAYVPSVHLLYMGRDIDHIVFSAVDQELMENSLGFPSSWILSFETHKEHQPIS